MIPKQKVVAMVLAGGQGEGRRRAGEGVDIVDGVGPMRGSGPGGQDARQEGGGAGEAASHGWEALSVEGHSKE